MQISRSLGEGLVSSANALDGLRRSLGVPLRLYLFTGKWHELRDPTQTTSNTIHRGFPVDELTLPSSLSQGPSEPFVLPVSNTSHVFGIPLESTCHGVVYAVGKSDSAMSTLLRAVAIQARQIRELQEESRLDSLKFDSFSDQILQSFEERNWLLQLTDHLQICEVNRSMSDVVQTLLPRLREILCAETVVFLPEASRGDFCAPFVATVLEDDDIVGKSEVAKVVNRFRSHAMKQVFISNCERDTSELDHISGVHSLMIACVSRTSCLVGWLVALNSIQDRSIPNGSPTDPDDPEFRDLGFGTPEAGLLKSAATVLATHHHNVRLFNTNRNLTVGVVRSLANAVDARDTYTHGHSDRVARLGQHLARCIGASAQQCEQILLTGLLHDIGKIAVPDHVLLKAGRLTDEEFDLIKQHPTVGYQILQHISELEFTLDGVLYHHEAWDGSGYPEGRTGQNIPLAGRLLAVVDSFDAMTSSRPYRQGMPFEKAETILCDGAGTQWDPDLVRVFLLHKEEFRSICQHQESNCRSMDTIDLNALYANKEGRISSAATLGVLERNID